MKRALITGVTGQDGSYLAELLLAKGYEVHGLKRRASSFNTERVDHIYEDRHEVGSRFHLHYGDLSDTGSLWRLLWEVQPEEVYNLAAQSHVRVSFDVPESTGDITAMGALRVLDGIRKTGVKARFYQASSSEMFGSTPPPQSEETKFHPRSPYGCAKLFAHSMTVNYRESYGMYACGGILFNHESPRRGETFVTRKVCRAAAHVKFGLQEKLYMGNLEAQRDWGYAPEYVEAMWMMMQGERAVDYVIGTGEMHSVGELVAVAFARVGLDWRDHVAHDARYERPAEVDALRADAGRARRELGWEAKTGFKELVELMVDAEVARLEEKASGRLKMVTERAEGH